MTASQRRTGGSSPVATYLEMIKVSHSVFALPFAIAGLLLAVDQPPAIALVLKVVLACVFARTAAMSFNRWADADLDAMNPRTATRAIPAGRLRRSSVGVSTLASAACFILTAAWINRTALLLSPVALLVLLGYSYTKRFTAASHFVLGLALGLSPVGAWVAVRATVGWLPVVLGLAVLFWTAGFDIIYACQDVDFDRRARLHSIPNRFGVRRALRLSRLCHVVTVALLVATGVLGHLGPFFYAGVGIVALLLLYEHSLVRGEDLSRVDLAFFTLNGIISMAFMTTTAIDRLV